MMMLKTAIVVIRGSRDEFGGFCWNFEKLQKVYLVELARNSRPERVTAP